MQLCKSTQEKESIILSLGITAWQNSFQDSCMTMASEIWYMKYGRHSKDQFITTHTPQNCFQAKTHFCNHLRQLSLNLLFYSIFSFPGDFKLPEYSIPLEPTHEIMVLFVLRKLILQTHMRSHPRGLIFGRTLRLFPYFMCANREGSGETALVRRLAWAFAGRLCDKYCNLMSITV